MNPDFRDLLSAFNAAGVEYLIVITSIDSVEFGDAWPERMQTVYGGVPTSVLSRRHLIMNKQASGRPQDLADLEWLRSHQTD